jgi:hypothetical protein
MRLVLDNLVLLGGNSHGRGFVDVQLPFGISLGTRLNHWFSETSRNSSDANVSRKTRSVALCSRYSDRSLEEYMIAHHRNLSL